jgi:hypothetical protein
MIAGAASGVYQGTIQNAQNKAQYTVQMAQTDSANLLAQDQADNNNAIRKAGNEFIAAQAALSNTQRSISNQNKADAIGQQFNATVTNQGRIMDQMVRGNVEQGIAAAAELGAVRAEQAARGVGGSSADIMRSTMKQTQARAQVMRDSAVKQTTFDQIMARSGIRSNLITSQDYGQTVAQLNQQAAIPQTYIAPAKAPDLTYAQMMLMGAAGGGGFQQFSNNSGNRGGTVGFDNSNGSGGVGQTSNFSSNSILNGVSSVGDDWSRGNASSGGSEFKFDSGSSNDWNLGGGGNSGSTNSNDFNFSLS